MITFKGTKEGIDIIIEKGANLNEVLPILEEKLKIISNLLEDTKINIDTKNRDFSDEELAQIRQVCEEHNLILQTDITQKIPIIIEKKEEPEKVKKEDIDKEKKTIFIKKTLRSGQKIDAEGNIVIIGDVNPGAEVTATGDIIIMGVLRGIVHAGCKGDKDSIICAIKLEPISLRIANLKLEKIEEKERNYKGELAYVKNNKVMIKTL